MFWNPALVVGTGGTGDRDRTDKADLVGVRALGLGDNGSEPSVVDEITGGTEAGREKEVQEETVVLGCVSGGIAERGGGICLHLGVQKRSGSFNNGDSLVVSSEGDEPAFGGLEHHGEVQDEVLGVHFGGELVRQIDLWLRFRQTRPIPSTN